MNGFVEIFRSKSLFGEVTNIGMNEEISIGDLVREIANLMKVDVEIRSEGKRIRPENSEVERLCCDNSKILSKTSWKPKYHLKTGLAETIDFLKSNLSSYKSELYNV